MKLAQLKYFKRLAECEHLNRTAEELYVSPAVVSTAITRLEEELGVRLFDRVGRGMKLNADGQRFYRHVESALAELDIAVEEAACFSRQENDKKITVATSTYTLWENAFSEFVLRAPDITFNYVTLTLPQLIDPQYNDRCDFIITSVEDMPPENYDYEILIQNDYPMLAVYEGHPLANRSEVSMGELAGERFVTLSTGFSSNRFFEHLCELAEIHPKIVAGGSYSFRTELVKKHMGIAVTTMLGSRNALLSGLKFVRIVNPPLRRVQAIFWKKGKYLSPQAKAFKSHMMDYCRSVEDTLTK